MSNLIKANNTFVFSPRYYLQKYLENQHIKQDKFTQALDTSNQKLNKILNGDLLKMIQQKARDFNHGMNADLNILQQLH